MWVDYLSREGLSRSVTRSTATAVGALHFRRAASDLCREERQPTPEREDMKAVVYNGPRDVVVTDVDDARIERPPTRSSGSPRRILWHVVSGSPAHEGADRTLTSARTDAP
jgi:hypothetical protein